MVICWKLRTRTLLTLRMSGEEAVINRSFGMSSDVYPPGRLLRRRDRFHLYRLGLRVQGALDWATHNSPKGRAVTFVASGSRVSPGCTT